MSFPNPGPATQTTGNVAGGPYVAYSGTQTNSVIGPAGSLIPFGGGGAAISAGTNAVSSGTLVLSNSNGVSFGINGQTLTASVPAVGGAQTGISSIADSANTQTVGMLSFANSNNITFGLSTGANTATLTASFAQSVQTQASGAIAGSGFTSAGNNIGLSGTLNSAGLSLSATVPGGGFSGGVSTMGNTAGNTGTYTGTVYLAGGNNITLSVATAAGGVQTITISGANAGGAQTGISGVVVSNTTYTSGTISFSNANGISFGSSAGQAITASYTVPTQSNQTLGVYASSNTTGQSSSSTVDARSISYVGQGNVSVGLSAGSVLISGATAAGATSVGLYAQGNTTGQSSSTTQALSSLNFSGAGLVSVGYSGSSVIISGPATTALAALTGAADSANTQTTGLLSFANSNGISFGLSTGANTGTLTASYTVPTTYANSAGVSTGGNTAGNTGVYTGQVVFAGGNNITLSVSSAAGGAQTITISGANAGGAQTGISGIQVSNTTYTSGTVTFQNANGISFGSSGANGISASYTVPTQTNQTLSVIVSSNTAGNTSGMTVDARSISFQGYGIASVGLSTTNTGSSILISATQSNQAVSAQGGSSAFQTLVFTNSNNVSFSNTGGSVWGSYALNVSAGAGTSNALSGITFANSNNITFGLSTGAGVGTLTASITAQSNQTGNIYGIGNTSGTSSGTYDARTLSIDAIGGAITVAASNSGWNISVPQTSSLVGVNGISVSTNGSTISVSYSNALSTYVPQWPASTSSLLINNLGVSTANPVFFPFQADEYLSFDMIAILQSYSYISSAVANSATQGVRFGLYSNNASTWSQISSGSSSIGLSNTGLSGTASYATTTSTGGYGYGTTTWTATLNAESLFGTYGYRNPIMQFGGSLSLSPGFYAIGMVSTASSSSANGGINQALIGNVVPISAMFGIGQSTTVTNQMLGMGYGTATTTGLPVSMAFSNMTNSLPVIPIITIAST